MYRRPRVSSRTVRFPCRCDSTVDQDFSSKCGKLPDTNREYIIFLFILKITYRPRKLSNHAARVLTIQTRIAKNNRLMTLHSHPPPTFPRTFNVAILLQLSLLFLRTFDFIDTEKGTPKTHLPPRLVELLLRFIRLQIVVRPHGFLRSGKPS